MKCVSDCTRHARRSPLSSPHATPCCAAVPARVIILGLTHVLCPSPAIMHDVCAVRRVACGVCVGLSRCCAATADPQLERQGHHRDLAQQDLERACREGAQVREAEDYVHMQPVPVDRDEQRPGHARYVCARASLPRTDAIRMLTGADVALAAALRGSVSHTHANNLSLTHASTLSLDQQYRSSRTRWDMRRGRNMSRSATTRTCRRWSRVCWEHKSFRRRSIRRYTPALSHPHLQRRALSCSI
jgi:hypothetical protein